LLILLDLSEQRPSPPRLLATSFDLTAAEAKLAALIGAGETVERAAERLGISKLTAQTQLKAVFSKTDTHRQAELAGTDSEAARVSLKQIPVCTYATGQQ
jgi:DNA-binding CsgD family transcriptional regulator